MHFRAQRATNPLHRFLDQFVERDDRHALLCVLAFAVTDAVQALHKRHDGENARARDLGSVVERTGRNTMRSPRIASSDRAMRRRESESVRFARFDPMRL